MVSGKSTKAKAVTKSKSKIKESSVANVKSIKKSNSKSKRKSVVSSDKKLKAHKEIIEEYELVPEHKFVELKKEVDEIKQSPFVSTPGINVMSEELEGVHLSILSLLGVLKQISENSSFVEAEKEIVSDELKPLVKDIVHIKKQNKDIMDLFNNIVDRLNDVNKRIEGIEDKVLPKPVDVPNPNLPPINGGLASPIKEAPVDLSSNSIPQNAAISQQAAPVQSNQGFNQNVSQTPQMPPMQNPVDPGLPQMPPMQDSLGLNNGLSMNGVDLPPLEKKKSKFSMFKK